MRKFWMLVAFNFFGCDVLFPEFAGKTAVTDAAADGATDAAGDAGATSLTGLACALADFRDYRSCASVTGGGIRVTVIETGDVTNTDNNGQFSFTFSHSLTQVTLLTQDMTNTYASMLSQLPVRGAQVALPMVSQVALFNAALSNGISMDITEGALLAYAIDPTGTPLATVTAQPIVGSLGPYYEGSATNEISTRPSTGSNGTIAFFNIASLTTVQLLLNDQLASDTFTLPIHAGAVTITTLPLAH